MPSTGSPSAYSTKRLTKLLIIGLSTTIAACTPSPSATQIIAQCQQDAYSKIGLEANEDASLNYLQRKAEFVRVCAVSAGLKFRSDAWSDHYFTVKERRYEKYGIWTTKPQPENEIYRRKVAAAEQEVRRQLVIDKASSQFWE